LVQPAETIGLFELAGCHAGYSGYNSCLERIRLASPTLDDNAEGIKALTDYRRKPIPGRQREPEIAEIDILRGRLVSNLWGHEQGRPLFETTDRPPAPFARRSDSIRREPAGLNPASLGDRRFESISLQRRALCEPDSRARRRTGGSQVKALG
jgi:hypothetical protein